MYIQRMVKKVGIISLGIAFLCMGIACNNQTEQPPKPKVVGQKIEMGSAKTEQPVSPEDDIAKESDQGLALDQGKIVMKDDGDTVISDELNLPADDLIMEIETSGIPELYNPDNKIDPFMPLFREGPKSEVEVSQKVEREKRIPRTPLERIDLSQLKLVGIIQAPGGNKGLVEEASGKGYIISTGTYMGTNGGRVVEISKDRVIVEEEVDDVLGKLTLQKRELKLQKPFGEN